MSGLLASWRKQWLIAAAVLVLASTGIAALSGGSDAQPTLAEFKPRPMQLQSLEHARYLHFQDPRFTAKFMAKYLDGGPAFDHVFYDVATPFEIMLHGNLHGSGFDLRLYKVGRQRVLLKNCMMGSCYSAWTGARVGHELARRSGRFHERSLLRQRIGAGFLRLGKRSGD